MLFHVAYNQEFRRVNINDAEMLHGAHTQCRLLYYDPVATDACADDDDDDDNDVTVCIVRRNRSDAAALRTCWTSVLLNMRDTKRRLTEALTARTPKPMSLKYW